MFKIIAECGNARVGELKTRSGKYKTPFFMPVVTMGTGKCISTDDYKDIGYKNIICNSLVLSMMPGVDVIRSAGGIHKFINFKGCIFTDCGGFQASRSMYEQSSNKGLHFVSPFNGKKVMITPERIMKIQMELGCDVAMMLDSMAGPKAGKPEWAEALRKTHRWAQESLEYHTDKKQLLFGICQGGFDAGLRKESAQFINCRDFDGIAIGGLAIGETKEQMYSALDASLPYITKDKPRYVMGVGSPIDILECVSRGVDCFDSVYPTKNARNNWLFTKDGPMDISKTKYRADNSRLTEDCECFVCRDYSKAYMHHLSKLKEPAGKRYRSYHNLWFMQRFIEDIRESIVSGKFEAFKSEFISKWKNL